MYKQIKIVLAILAITMLHTASAQRPSFAGSRPIGGLNQKDKYHTTVDNGAEIANRFGGASASAAPTNTIAFGAPQRPPVGLPVVMPLPVYVPLGSSTVQSTATPQFVVNNRIGGTDGLATASAPASASASASGSTGVVSPTAAAPNTIPSFPLDALGDQLLVDQLNQVPEDRRPFWFLNAQAIEAQRNGTGSNFAGAIASRGSFFG